MLHQNILVMYVFNFLDFSELLINDSVTSCDVNSFFFIPATNLVRVKSEMLDMLLNYLWYNKKFFVFSGEFFKI